MARRLLYPPPGSEVVMWSSRLLGSAVVSGLLLAACGVNTGVSGTGTTPTPGGTPTPHVTPTATPTATPTPPPKTATGTCSFVWANDNGDGTLDFYEVDIAGALWNNTTVAFQGTAAVGYFVLSYDPVSNTFVQAGLANSGAIALSVTDMNKGSAAGFTDTASHTYLDATAYFSGASNSLGGPSGSGGTGSFSGNLSDPNPSTAVTPGAGSINLTIN